MIKRTMKKTFTLLITFIGILTLTYSTLAFTITTPSYKADSTHLGTSTSNGSTQNFNNIRTTTTHQQGSNKDVTSPTYKANSGWFNLTVRTVLTADAALSDVSCSKDNLTTVQNCESLSYGDTITHFNATCSAGTGIDNVTFLLYNLEDNTTQFDNISYTYQINNNFIFNASYYIQDSGNWTLNVSCFANSIAVNSSKWRLPFGWLNISVLSPTGDIDAEKFNTFTFESLVECVGGECGDVNVTLDPQPQVETIEEKDLGLLGNFISSFL
tara:strand:+ start:450 stop:1259 length:810 start_codon:yes stop_codon:yes gene_type:complete